MSKQMLKILSIVLTAVLFFSFPCPSYLQSSEAARAYAQSTAAAPEKPAKPKISFTGGPGDTPKTAIIISGAPNSRVGIDAEYFFLQKIFGRPNLDWKLKRQSVLHHQHKIYDKMEIRLKDGKRKTIFFDITEFYGKL